MSELASSGQLRAAFLRWTLFLVPGIVLLGFLSGAVGRGGLGDPWFDRLVKPSIYPPPATFGIVWSVLYIMMGLALAVMPSLIDTPVSSAASCLRSMDAAGAVWSSVNEPVAVVLLPAVSVVTTFSETAPSTRPVADMAPEVGVAVLVSMDHLPVESVAAV